MSSYLTFVFVVLFCSCVLSASKKKELVVDVVSKPDNCYETAGPGDTVFVHYTGLFEDGKTVFDSSRAQGREPLEFELGQQRVIPGWEQGIIGMCVGEKRNLKIPPHLAYGKNGHPPSIPGDATLLFETELVDLKKKAVESLDIMKLIQFLAIPAAVLYVMYHLYNKVSESGPSKKELKEEKRRKKRK